MMVMTAKVDFKKIMLIVAGAAALILAAILLLGGGDAATQTAAKTAPSGNDGRVQFLKEFGWDVTTSPTDSSQVKIPKETTEVFDRYNTLQKGQGYDLTQYAGKNVMRYVYQINNYPGATQSVYATLLVYKDQIIGGDVTDTAAGGKVQGFRMPTATAPAPTTTPSTESSAATTP